MAAMAEAHAQFATQIMRYQQPPLSHKTLFASSAHLSRSSLLDVRSTTPQPPDLSFAKRTILTYQHAYPQHRNFPPRLRLPRSSRLLQSVLYLGSLGSGVTVPCPETTTAGPPPAAAEAAAISSAATATTASHAALRMTQSN